MMTTPALISTALSHWPLSPSCMGSGQKEIQGLTENFTCEK